MQNRDKQIEGKIKAIVENTDDTFDTLNEIVSEVKNQLQIEEMAKHITIHTTHQMVDRYGNVIGEARGTNSEYTIAKQLYDAGYRKASDVAREIFEEIEDCYMQMLEEANNTIEEAILDENHSTARIARYGKDVMLLTLDTLTKRLKKKYTEGEG